MSLYTEKGLMILICNHTGYRLKLLNFPKSDFREKKQMILLMFHFNQCWKFLSPGRPRRSGLGLGDLFPEVGSPGGRPEMAISQVL